MTPRPSPRFALWILDRVVPDAGPLAGDVAEEHARGRSRWWVWWQVAGAVVAALTGPAGDIRPLRLLEAQPLDAMRRTLLFRRQGTRVNLNANPTAHFGGLSVLVLGGIMTATAPMMWAVLAIVMLGGIAMGVALIRVERPMPRPLSVRMS
ncbi:MAG: hypothetical protein AB7O67_01135 [Vicinamibacterales bacterium]